MKAGAGIKWKYISDLVSGNPATGPYGQKSIKLPSIAAASQAAAATGNEGNVYYDLTANDVKFSDGASWTSLSTTAGVGTLQQVTTAGKTSNVTAIAFSGASSAGNALVIGDASDKVGIYASGGNCAIVTTGTADLVIAPDGGDTDITGTLDVSGAFTAASANIGAGAGALAAGATTLASCVVAGVFTAGSFSVDAMAAATPGGSLKLDGEGAGGVNICSISTGGITLSDDVAVAAAKTVTIAGAAASNVLTVTAGDVVVSDGSLSLTDADDAASLVITNNTLTSGSLIDVDDSGVVTGKLLDMKADNLTTGSMVYLESSAAGFSGKYIQCSDGAADDFSVGLYGATIIAGNAAGTAALTVSAGDLKLTAGVIDEDCVTDVENVFTRACAATTKDFVQILCTNASDDHCALYVNHSGTAGVPAMELLSAGTDDALKITVSNAAGTALQCISGAGTDSLVKLDGATGHWVGADGVGMLALTSDGTPAHANSSLCNITLSGAGVAAGMGNALRIVDSSGNADHFSLYISSATGEAMKVDVGKSVFDEGILVGDGAAGYVSSLGTQDLILQTNEGTNSATITITDGANGNVTVDMNGSGRLAVVGPALADATTEYHMPFVIRREFDHADPDGNNDIQVCNANTPKMLIIDAWIDNDVAEGGAMTVTLRDAANGGGNAISNAIDVNATTVQRVATLSTVELAAGSSIYANFSGNPGTCEGTLYIMAVEVG